MYTIDLNGTVFYDPRVQGVEVTDAVLNLEVNKFGSFTFKIPPTHLRYGDIRKLSSVVDVYYNSVLIFRGRPLNESVDFDKIKTVTCEGGLAFLADTIQRPYDYSGSVSGFLKLILERHNQMVVATGRKIQLGNITVTDPNDYIVRADSGHTKTWTVITDKLIKSLGGYMMIRTTGGINYLDYLADSAYRSQQTINLGENLVDLTQTLKGENVISAVIPIGAEVENEVGDKQTVDITSVNNGLDYVFNQTAVDTFGWIYQSVVFDNVTEPANLKRKAEAYLGQMIAFSTGYEVSAIDRNLFEGDFDRFRLFEYVKVISPYHSIDDYYLIKKLKIDLLKPQNSKLVVGADGKTLTEKQTSNLVTVETIRKESAQQAKDTGQTIRELTLTIEETAERYAREVKEILSSEIGEWSTEMSTQFEQLKDEFSFQFTEIITQIENVDGETREKFSEIIKYIRFVDGKIYLGEVNNDLQVIIANDRISFMQGNAEVAYIHHNKLYIYEGEFINNLKLGKFAFIPRSNGNLSFKKVEN